MRKDLGLVVFVLVAVVVGFVTWNAAGSVTRGLGPGPAGPAAAAAGTASPGVTAFPGPGSASPAPSGAQSPAGSPGPDASASAVPSPTPSATPKPVRKAVNVRIENRPAAVFASEQENTWCAAAGVQIALNVNGPKVDTTRARQARIRKLERAATTRKDSRNGGAGPLGMVATLNDLGPVNYELRIYPTRADALRGAAKAIRRTGHAVLLLAWRGAHTWVMTGYRANADPAVFPDARVTGAYIIDPWYPRVSRIWGPSDKPGVYQDAAEMKRNYLPWRRPEGHYPGRDGKFLAIVPTD